MSDFEIISVIVATVVAITGLVNLWPNIYQLNKIKTII